MVFRVGILGFRVIGVGVEGSGLLVMLKWEVDIEMLLRVIF